MWKKSNILVSIVTVSFNSLRDHKEVDFNYCICWANETWNRNWYAQERTVLLEQRYGYESAWIKHFEYLNTFFRDKRYIKI